MSFSNGLVLFQTCGICEWVQNIILDRTNDIDNNERLTLLNNKKNLVLKSIFPVKSYNDTLNDICIRTLRERREVRCMKYFTEI